MGGRILSMKSGSGRTSESNYENFIDGNFPNQIMAFCFLFRKGDRIYHQLRMLGGSYDWDRACFTMDPVRYLKSIIVRFSGVIT